ncbi:hypothetical protein GCM10025879_09500 [Leuconostoc litchii]|uniref:ABC-2 type transporter transmembrane domain-containing protein n=1 Tax=Leuconostoc litchii TaxID=1981069 RepID=A0A6P2CPX1_9LACO|nr:ABC transporter permease [Leuconostoc litchii]TYC47654.1 hypothetical protein ESZ47_05845 [Leuconostoc litchii]GMA69704.1 hypothetical protein GCM10025879_09500 [Leuconostoc litchii]
MSGWRTILENKRSLIKWLVVTILPVILVAGYLGSVSHVTQHAYRLRVGVVNLDSAAQFEGEKQNVGTKLTDQLLTNKKLTFKSYKSQQEAQQALKLGQITSVIIFPKQMTKQLASFKSTGQNVSVKQTIATGNNQFATQYSQQIITNLIGEINVKLSMGISNDSTLKNLAKQSNTLADKTADLQANLQAVGNAIDIDTAKELQSDTNDLTTQLATYTVELNTAISNSDTDKIKEAAAKINDVSYKMQTTVAGGISNITANLSNTKALSQQSGIIQSDATAVKNGQNSISSKLNSLLSDKADTTSSLTQMLTLSTTDIRQVKNNGQAIFAQCVAMGVTAMAILFGLVLSIKPLKPEALALEQWWGTFQVGGVLSVISALLMTGSAVLWHVPITNVWFATGIIVLAEWVMMSIIWYLKQLLGQNGWWLALGLFILQAVIVVISYPSIVQETVFGVSRTFWPLSTLISALNHLIFGGDVQQEVMILIIWWIILTILLVSNYRLQQRHRLIEKVVE